MNPVGENDYRWEEPATFPNLVENQVVVWRFDPRSQFTHVDRLASLLSGEEHSRLARFVDEKDKHNFVVCRGVLRLLLAQGLGTDDEPLHIQEGHHGKPQIAEHDHSGHVQLNLSHTEGLCLIAMSKNLEVGVDVERIQEMDELPRMARSYLTADEYERWQGMEEAHKTESFYDHWCAKEAVIKASGSGLSIHPAQINILTALSGSPISGVQEDGCLFEFQDCHLLRLPLEKEYKGWLAVLGESERVDLYDLPDQFESSSGFLFPEGMNVEK